MEAIQFERYFIKCSRFAQRVGLGSCKSTYLVMSTVSWCSEVGEIVEIINSYNARRTTARVSSIRPYHSFYYITLDRVFTA